MTGGGSPCAPCRPIVLTTLPHFLALIFVIGKSEVCFIVYSVVVALSATASITWHIRHESRDWFLVVDYGLAFAWFIMDVVIASTRTDVRTTLLVCVLNLLVFGTNMGQSHFAGKGTAAYEWAHSVWHLLSCAKAIYIAFILGRS